MKKIITTFLFTILLLPCADAKLPFIVQSVYFKPTDALPAPKTLGQTMHDVQMLYLEQMEDNGYGAKTFRLERNAAGDTIIHTVNGRHATAHYRATTYNSIKAELPQRLLNPNNITVIIAGGVQFIDNRVWGTGFPVYGGACGGKAIIAATNANFGVPLIAHELGHAFGLYHNIIGDPSLMGRGRDNIPDVIEFNDYETRWLDKHHYFNAVHEIAHYPKLVHTHRFRETQEDIIRFKFDIESIGELHQAQIYRYSDVAIVGWERIDGNHATAAFFVRRNLLRNQNQIGVQMLDTLGNHYIEHIHLGNLDQIASEVKKKLPIEEGVTPVEPTTVEKNGKKDSKEPRSASPQGKLVLLWARLKARR